MHVRTGFRIMGTPPFLTAKKCLHRFCWLALAGAAQQAAADRDDVFFSDLPVVASASRLPQRLADAPASVTVIDREMIQASGARVLSDIFRLVPGFQTFAHSDTAARVNYHGITDDNDFSPRVQVLVDGRSLHSPLFRSGVNWALIPVALEDIERIEVVRGSNSVSYGTNAFLGVVNIVTTDPALTRGVSVSTSHGNQGVRDHTFRGGARLGESGNFRLTVQEVRDDGLNDNFDWRDRFLNRRVDARLGFQAGPRDELELLLGKVEGRFTRGRLDVEVSPPVSRTDNPMRDLEESSTWMQLRWTRALAEGGEFSLRYAFNEDKGDDTYLDPDLAPGFRTVNLSGDWGRRNELEAMHSFAPTADTRLIWGGSWRRDEVSSATMLRDKGEVGRDVWRIFANGEWKPARWLTANLGVSSEDDSLAGHHISPRASLAWHLTPENTLRAGYAKAWRTASIRAYHANYRSGPGAAQIEQIGNPELPAERLDSWELAYLGDWREWRMSLDVRYFHEKLGDRLMVVRPGANPTPDSEQPIQDIVMRGHEFQWKWQPWESTRLVLAHAALRIDADFSVNGRRLTRTRGSNLSASGEALYTALAEESAPRRSTSLLLMQKLPWGVDFSVAHYRVGAMKWTRNTEVSAYRRTDVRLGYPFVIGRQRGEIAGIVQSVNGEHIEQRRGRSEPTDRVVDRRHWVTLRLDF